MTENKAPVDQESLARIARMEATLDETKALTEALRESLDALKAADKDAKALFAYYGSEDWYADREMRLPDGFKAGVLSEDLAYDAITELRDLAFDMLETGTEILKDWI